MSKKESLKKNALGGLLGRIRSNISAKLILAMALLAVLPLAIAGFFFNRITTGDLVEQTGRATQEVARGAADTVAQALAENVHLLEAVAVSDEMRFLLNRSNLSYGRSEQEITAEIMALDRQWSNTPPAAAQRSDLIRSVLSNQTAKALQDFRARFPAHVEVFLTDRYGAVVASTGVTSDYYQADEIWWQQTYQQGAGAVYLGKPELDKSSSTISLIISVPVRGASNELAGVLRSTLDVKEIRDALGGIKLGRSSRIVVVDAEGAILFDPVKQPDPDQKLPAQLLRGEALRGARPGQAAGWMRAEAFSANESIVGYARGSRNFGIPAMERLQWTAIATIETEEALTTVSSSNRFQLALGLVVAFVAIGVAFFLASRLTAQIRHINDLFREIRNGNLQRRAPVVSHDELGGMTSDLNMMLDETLSLIQSRREREDLQNSIMKLLNDVSGVAEGDLTVEAEVRSDITGAIADSFNYMTAELREIIGKVQEVTVRVGSSASETQTTTERLAQESEAHAQQMLAARSVIEEVSSELRQVSESAHQSRAVAEASLETARQGSGAVQDTIRGMSGIRDQVQETAKRIKRLGESSQEIGEIVQLIGDIAYRTSVLALNASIQAARAGEAGRGFAVVAEEIERLSKRSTEATKHITELVKTIQSGTSEAIAAMEESTREVVEGSHLADRAGQALIEIESVSIQLADLIQDISRAAERQAEGSEQVSHTIAQISESTHHTASSIKQSALSVNNLAALANELRSSVASFKLSGDHYNGNGRR